MNADYITHYGTDLSAVNAARVSMNKESDWVYCDIEGQACTDRCEVSGEACPRLSERDAKLVNYLAKNKHFSCFEHQGVTLRLKVPLFVRSQIHRHRTFSYNEISRRYVKDELEFYWPDKWRKAAENVKQGSSDEEFNIYSVSQGIYPDAEVNARDFIGVAGDLYTKLVEAGCCPEQARMILPQNLYTQFYMTGNLRNWAHFLKLRLDPHAQKEVRDVAEMCAKIIEPLFPCSFNALMEN